MEDDRQGEVDREGLFAQPPCRGHAAVVDVLLAADEVEKVDTHEGDEDRGDRVHAGGTHRPVHREPHREPRQKHPDRCGLHRQQRDENHVDQRVEVDAQRQVVEQKDLQQRRHQKQKCVL